MDQKTRKTTLRMLSNGVYIMTSRSGERYGAATVTWVSQASFKPPMLVVAVRRSSNVFQCMGESHSAAIHIVGSNQQAIARKFFSPTWVREGAINGEPFTDGRTSAPILSNLPAFLECRVDRILDGRGDHAVVILEVVEATCREQVRPLTIADSPWEYAG